MLQYLSTLNWRRITSKKESITVRAVGGLGNQLFILFFGLAVSRALGTKLIVDDKLMVFGSNPDRKIEILNLKFGEMHFEFKKNYLLPRSLIKQIFIVRKIFWHIFNSQKYLVNEIMAADAHFRFRNGQTFSGYFQDWFYADYIHELNNNLRVEVFNPGSAYQKLRSELKVAEPVCIHVRLGDYLNFPEIYSILPENYYLDAIDYLNADKKLIIWIFIESQSELVEYYPKLFALTDKVIDRSSGLSDTESFALLQESKSIISSNSTYSLWAAWFAEKNNSRIVVPLQMGIIGSQDGIISDRWDRYDLFRREVIPKTKQESGYKLKKVEFESKFKSIGKF